MVAFKVVFGNLAILAVCVFLFASIQFDFGGERTVVLTVVAVGVFTVLQLLMPATLYSAIDARRQVRKRFDQMISECMNGSRAHCDTLWAVALRRFVKDDVNHDPSHSYLDIYTCPSPDSEEESKDQGEESKDQPTEWTEERFVEDISKIAGDYSLCGGQPELTHWFLRYFEREFYDRHPPPRGVEQDETN